jgi:hypothetical protein
VERSAVDIEKADMVVTCSVDLKGCTRMAQRLQTLVLQQDFGNSVQFHMEYLKYSVWEELKKSHATESPTGRNKKKQLGATKWTPDPDAILSDEMRQHPYLRAVYPTLEIFMLLTDRAGVRHGETLLSISAPDVPTEEDLGTAIQRCSELFARRTLDITLTARSTILPDEDGSRPEDTGSFDVSGVAVEVLCFHPRGFARLGAKDAKSVEPMVFAGETDSTGSLSLRILPAPVNKVRILDGPRFHAHAVDIRADEIRTLKEGPTPVALALTAKEGADIRVMLLSVYERADQFEAPTWTDADVLNGTVEVKSPFGPQTLTRAEDGSFYGRAPEGFVEIVAVALEREVAKPFFILPGFNSFAIPMLT